MKWTENLNRHFSRKTHKWQQVHEKMLNITHHQGNANQNPNEDVSVGPVVKNLLANAGDTGSIPGLGRSSN